MKSSDSVVDPEEILSLWFSEEAEKRWFKSTPEFDDELRERFEGTVKAALSGALAHWCDEPRSALALVIVLDQLPLNIYRGRPESFAGEASAREVAKRVIDQGWDREMETKEKAFLYIPFMHSENRADQDRAVELYQQAGMEDNVYWANHHRGIVERFGRFPHRNAILGRESTEEEQQWLNSDEAFCG